MDAKLATEKTFAKFGHKIHHWHADNGRYADNSFQESVKACNQTISYCGVGAHHQNDLAEAAIKKHTLGARTLLLHAKRFWPAAITAMLWPFGFLIKRVKHRL